MPIDDRTTNRNYQLPNAGNYLADDVLRLRAALNAIDADVYARYTKTEVDALIANLINGAPGALDTLDELAAALGDDANFASTVTTALANRYTKTESDARYVQGVTQTENVFTGNGSQTSFTLTQAPPTRESLLVTVDGVVQPTTAYNISGTSLILSEAPASGSSIRVLMLGTAGPVQSASTLSFTQAGTSAVTRTVDSKLKDVVSVKDFGAVGDGVADDTIAIQAAINNSHRKVVYFPSGIYKVTDTLNITVLSYSLVGERTERGQNTQAYRNGQYSAVRINFAPADTTKFLINIFQATAGINVIGPFEHKNLCFTLNGANGLQFGSESLPIADGAGGQSYVFGVRFENCNFETTGGVYGSDANGVISLSNRRHIGLAKCFESVIRDCSFNSGDYAVRSLGCDKLKVTGCRAYTSRPLDFNGSGTFTVQHTVHDFQTEGWLISPIRNNGVDLAVSNSRFEANVASPNGYARFVIPTCTATVTANSNTLTFSRSMNNILIPGWSLIQLTDGTNTDTCFVTSVSDTTVTISTLNFRFTWSGTATTITRIHTFGPLHAPGNFGSTYTNISAGAGINCPAFVYVGCRGAMYLTNCFAEEGAYGNIECLAVGNRASQAQFAMNGQMVLTSCTSLLTPAVPSPLIRTINWNESNGLSDKQNNRQNGADSFDGLSKAQRKWIYTPARYQTTFNSRQSITFKRVAGDAGTNQAVFAWFLDGTNPGGRILEIFDNSLPSSTSGNIRILIRARAVSANTTLAIVTASQQGGGANLRTLNISTNWATYSISTAMPHGWGSGGTSLRLLQLTASADAYVAAVAVLDEDPAADGTYFSNGVAKALAHRSITLTSGVGQVIARGSGPHASFKVKAFGHENNQFTFGYATVYGEYIVQTSTYGGSYAVRGVNTLFQQKHSINASVIDLSLAITAAIVSGNVEITATATLTGSAGSTIALVHFEIEGLGTTGLTPS